MVGGAPDPYLVARRLGFDRSVIRRLRERGHLPKLGLDETEIRLRLLRAHRAYVRGRHEDPVPKEEP
jgi:hypothetical protein